MKIIISTISLLFLLTSCNQDLLILDINFGASELDQEKFKENAFNKKIFKEESNGYIKSTYVDVKLDGNTFKSVFYFNNDVFGDGALREYTYSLTTMPFTKTGNDTVIKFRPYYEFIKESDFNNLKLSLEKRYGTGKKVILDKYAKDEVCYKYSSTNSDIILSHGALMVKSFNNEQFVNPLYYDASISIRSKNYDEIYRKELNKRKSLLKPDDVVGILFNKPRLDNYYDEYGGKRYRLYIAAKSETYKSYFVTSDIIECKGILEIKDSYNEIIDEISLVYEFNPPLFSVKKNIYVGGRPINYNAYTYNLTSKQENKYLRLSNHSSGIKATFKVNAVLFENGDVIKE
jgi:hypothetical protein